MENPSVMTCLERARPFPFQNSLRRRHCYSRALRVAVRDQSSELGKARRGPRKATAPGDYDAKDLCAAVVADVWHYLHGEPPSRTNRTAARAASAFWRASGGDLEGWSAAQIGLWPPHFDRVISPALEGKKERSSSAVADRQELLKKHLNLERSGRPENNTWIENSRYALPHAPRSRDRTCSPAPVSGKRECFDIEPENIDLLRRPYR